MSTNTNIINKKTSNQCLNEFTFYKLLKRKKTN